LAVLASKDITPDEVKRTVRGILPRGREQARASFRRLKAFLDWAVESGDYGLKVSPCEGIKTAALIGDHVPSRELRELSDVEIVAYWRASSSLGYPLDAYFKFLLLTACRRNEVADAQWCEFDFKDKLWVIPKARMKGRADKAREHAVPLTPDIVALLESLPRFVGGDFVFSSTSGRRAINGFTTAKARLDKAMRSARQGIQAIHDSRCQANGQDAVLGAADTNRSGRSVAGARQAGPAQKLQFI
jgi:integrase